MLLEKLLCLGLKLLRVLLISSSNVSLARITVHGMLVEELTVARTCMGIQKAVSEQDVRLFGVRATLDLIVMK